MNNSTVNLTITEASTDSMTHYIGLINTLFISLSIINILFGVLTNSCVIWLIVTGRGIASEFFTLNLSVCEIGVSLNFFFSILFSSFELSCFLNGLLITGRPLFESLICVERYLAVVHPVTFLKYKPLRYRVICCTAAWIISLGSCLSCLYIIGSYNTIVYNGFFSTQFLLFLSIQLFCCVAVLRALKQSGPGERGREREEENHMKRKAFNIILITTVSMLIIYIPFIFVGFYNIVVQQDVFLGFISCVCFVLASFVHPVLYLHRAGKLFSLFCCFSP